LKFKILLPRQEKIFLSSYVSCLLRGQDKYEISYICFSILSLHPSILEVSKLVQDRQTYKQRERDERFLRAASLLQA
jgi:hypothetical protein